MRFRRDEDGVSVVVGAVLVFGLLILAMVTVQVSYVPVWEEDAEAARAQQVQGQLIAIKAEGDQQVDNRSGGGVALPLELGESRSSRLFRPITLPGHLEFDPTGLQTTLSSNKLFVLIQDDESLAGADETWVTITSGDTIDNISKVQHLRIRIEDPVAANDGDNVILTFTDDNGDFAGSFMAYIVEDPPEKFINTRVTNASGDVVFDQGASYHQVAGIDFHWVDVLNEANGFRPIISIAEKPLQIALSENGLSAEYAIQYSASQGGGSVIQGSSGKLIPNYSETLTGGTLDFDTQNLYFLDQRYVLEYGALIVVQDDGAAIISGPSFEVDLLTTTTRVSLTIPHYTGDSESRSSGGTATLILRGETGSSYTAQAPSFIINHTTSYPSTWENWWTIQMQESGLSSLAGQYVITTGADWAQLAIYGTTPDPNSEEYDLAVTLKQGTVRVKIQT